MRLGVAVLFPCVPLRIRPTRLRALRSRRQISDRLGGIWPPINAANPAAAGCRRYVKKSDPQNPNPTSCTSLKGSTVQTVPLELMQSGESGTIVDLDGNPDVITRIREMGIREGAQIEMVQSGEPCIIAVGNQRLSLRVDQTTLVYVEIDG